MHVLVTGAGGFVGQALVQRLLTDVAATPFALTRLTAIDQRFGPGAESWRVDQRVSLLEGDFADRVLLDSALAQRPDWVFHLASVPGSLAEREQALGLQVNLLAPISLLQRLADKSSPPRVVFASSVAVYGALPTEGVVDESCPARPALSYGAHKRMTEILLADLSRQGLLDGVSLRLPGIVARPRSPTGHGSAFMSDLIRSLMTDEPGEVYDCPVSAAASCWWMSLACCVNNLLHAARLPAEQLQAGPCLQLPVLTATVGELVAAIEQLTGHPANLSYHPNEVIETLFGRLPTLSTPYSRSLGFVDDGSLADLIRQAMAA
ncbi:MAG: NAD-dependent epimerase/dehydratase family protein [Pseudomonadota bacterium]